MTGCGLCPDTSLPPLTSPSMRKCVLQTAWRLPVWEASVSRPPVPRYPSLFGTESLMRMPCCHGRGIPARGGGLGASESGDIIVRGSHLRASKHVLLHASSGCCWACHGSHVTEGTAGGQG